MKIPLFDIDWTLLLGGGKMHQDAIDETFKHIYGIPNASIQEIDANGMIITQVLIEVLKLHNVSEAYVIRKMPEAITFMEEYFTAHESDDKSTSMSGAYELLFELKKNRLPIGLLTGNTEKIGWRRIENAGLKDFFDFGAFGDMAYKRADLVSIAKKRARTYCNIDPLVTDYVVIGDSPYDIACGKANNIFTIAVATGSSSSDILIATGADLVVRSLQEQQKILEFLNK